MVHLLVIGLFVVELQVQFGSPVTVPMVVLITHFRFAIPLDSILLLHPVGLVELSVVIAATVDQDVVLPVMQVMCSAGMC